MDRRHIDDHHIVARYLADQLTDAEREAFEAYYLAHPEMVNEMEAAARIKVGLMQLQEAGEIERLMLPVAPRWLRPAAAAAAAAIVGIALATFLLPQPAPVLVASSSTLVNRRGTPLPVAATYTIFRTPNGSYGGEVELPGTPHAIALRVLPEYQAQPARYRIVLARLDDDDKSRDVATVGGLAPAPDGFVAVALNSARLEAGRYRLSVSGDEGTSAATHVSTFLIHVRPAR